MIYSEEYMIVLGAKLKNDRITSTLKHRLDMAAYYKQQHPETPIVVSGGISPGNTISEAQAMKEYLVKKYRIPEKSIIKEEKSRTTLENLKFCREILPEDGRILLFTSNYHMYRAEKYAIGQGFSKIQCLPAKTDIRKLPKNICREILAVLKGKLTGKL